MENNDKLLSAVIRRQAQSGDLTYAMGTYRNACAVNRLSGSAQAELDKFFKPLLDLQAAQNAYGQVTGGATAQAIASEAQKEGVDPKTALTVWSAEGGVTNPTTKNPASPAHRYFSVHAGYMGFDGWNGSGQA